MKDPVSIFLELCKISSPSFEEAPMSAYLRKWARVNGLYCREDSAGKKISSDSNNLYITGKTRSSRSPQVVLSAHMDTIHGTCGIKIKSDRGKLCAEGGKILGADDKAGIAVIMYAVETLKRENILKNINLMCFFSVCEELGLKGSSACDMSMFNKKSFVYVLDSELPVGTIITGAPYLYKFEIRVRGKASHAGIDPAKGKNSIKAAAYLINKFPQGRIDAETTFNIGIIEGGSKVNIVPELTTIKGEARSHRKAKIERIFSKLRRVCKSAEKTCGVKIIFSCEPAFEGYNVDSGHPMARAFEKAAENAGIPFRKAFSNGGSDANILNARGICSLNTGIAFKYPHSEKEYIKSSDINNAGKLFVELCKALTAGGYFV
ncbi:MAG: M20/M25/M40 family metallo-hydrolase [Candidatus Aureabacteria bacterium]|nr:M20/M25/M40 family metallo-hydrolase [Candidatus Auribacterota bacterium]